MNNTNETSNNNNTNYKKIFKRETKVIALVVICLTLAALGTSYAVFLQVNNNNENQVVQAGSLVVTYANKKASEYGEKGYLTQESDDDDKNCLAPKTDEEGNKSGCEINFSIMNDGTLPARYDLLIYNDVATAVQVAAAETKEPVPLENFKYSLTKKLASKTGEEVNEQNENPVATSAALGDDSKKYKLPENASEEEKVYDGASILDQANIDVGETYEFSLRIWLKKEASKELIASPVNLKLGVIDIVYENETVADTVLASMGLENGIHEIMPTPSNTNPVATEDGTSKIREFRYSGKDANNYVYFNCQNEDGQTNCEKWRILGITEEDKEGNKERTVKLVNANSTVPFAKGLENGLDQLKSQYNSLTEIAQKQIIETEYKIGTQFDANWTGSQLLEIEHGSSTVITSPIGILTISDYLLSSDKWESVTINNFVSSATDSYLTNTLDEQLLDKNESGYYKLSQDNQKITTVTDTDQTYNEHLVVTLNKDVKITGGEGTETNPYILSK